MDFYDGYYYRVNKILLLMIGLWPFQAGNQSRGILLVFGLVMGSQFAAKVCGLITSMNDIDLVFESIGPMMVDIASGIKIINGVINSKRIKSLLMAIQENYASLENSVESGILNTYANNGRRFTLIYAGSLFTSMILFMAMPIVPQLLDQGVNKSEKELIHNVEYFVDAQTYYYPILLHSYAMILMCITAIVAMDCTFVIFVQHACGLFSLVGHRLNEIADDDIIFDLQPSIENDKPYEKVIRSIIMHKKAIEFSNIVNDSFGMTFLLQTGLNMLLISLTAIQALMNLSNVHELVRQAVMQFASLMHIFFESFQSQQLIDHCTLLQDSLIHTKWYSTSLRSRKVLSFMIWRAQYPSMLTAVGLFPMSMETFATIVKTSMSYFTVLRSMQQDQ